MLYENLEPIQPQGSGFVEYNNDTPARETGASPEEFGGILYPRPTASGSTGSIFSGSSSNNSKTQKKKKPAALWIGLAVGAGLITALLFIFLTPKK
jgi:hypothetical protein